MASRICPSSLCALAHTDLRIFPLTAMAKAAALVRGRDYVLPEDVSLVFGDVVPHRLLLSPRAEADRSFDPASELLERVPAPRIS